VTSRSQGSSAGVFEELRLAQPLPAELFEPLDRLGAPGKLEVVGGRPGNGLTRVDAVEGDRQVVELLMVDLDVLIAEVEHDGTVAEPFVGAEVPDQPDVVQGAADEPGKTTTVSSGDWETTS
jgi:hypothetical protein